MNEANTQKFSAIHNVGPLHLETPALHRNQACRTCRSRKIRCDARKPVCTPCSKSRRKRQGQPVKVECIYPPGASNTDNFTQNEVPVSRPLTPPAIPPAGSKRVGKEKGVVERENEELRRRVEELEGMLRKASISNPKPSPSADGRPSGSSQGVDVEGMMAGIVGLGGQGEEGIAGFPMTDDFSSQSILPDTDPNNTLFTLLYPGYPSSLPHPTILRSLVEAFFSRYVTVSDILDRTSFLLRLTLPPTDIDFPNETLLHAICALASLKVEADDPLWKAVGARTRYWGTFETPGDYHYNVSRSLGMAELGTVRWKQFGLNYKRRHIFQITQSLVLITTYAYLQSRFLAAYTLSGLSVRMCIALGLNHIERSDPMENRQQERIGVKRMAMEPPVSTTELYERAVTFWFAALHDWFCSAATGWSMAVRLDDITSILPVKPTCAEDQELVLKSLDIHAPQFFTNNDPKIVGSYQLQIKACVLIAKVVEFTQHAGWGRERGMEHPDFARDSDYFKNLDREIVEFRLSFPKSLNSPNHTSSPAPLYVAHALSHVSTVLLHAPYCSADPDDISMIRCLTSSKAIIAALLVINQNALEGAFINPFSCFALSTAGRTLIRDYALKKATGDIFGATSTEAECKLLIQNLTRIGEKVPMATSIAKILTQLLNDPSILTKGFFPTRFEQNVAAMRPLNSKTNANGVDRMRYGEIPRSHLAFFGVPKEYHHHPMPPRGNADSALFVSSIEKFQDYALNHNPEFVTGTSTGTGNSGSQASGSSTTLSTSTPTDTSANPVNSTPPFLPPSTSTSQSQPVTSNNTSSSILSFSSAVVGSSINPFSPSALPINTGFTGPPYSMPNFASVNGSNDTTSAIPTGFASQQWPADPGDQLLPPSSLPENRLWELLSAAMPTDFQNQGFVPP
ncbi:hypothetical protein BT69DRAFT_712870 [Atractiella rhizophila]|nr:hypothetical protein BT69DRAFT_712870 [Atractiella rhizophila]